MDGWIRAVGHREDNEHEDTLSATFPTRLFFSLQTRVIFASRLIHKAAHKSHI